MTDEPTTGATVLVIEDERHLADLYADYLGDTYRVVTAHSGEEGLDRLNDDVDVVLVEQRMSSVSGHEVLAAIEERDVDCQVALITADTPDFDVIGVVVDDYLVKPVTREDAHEVVDRLLTITEYTEALQQLTTKKLARNVLRVEKTRVDLSESEHYRNLEADIGRLQSHVDELAAELDLEERNLVL